MIETNLKKANEWFERAVEKETTNPTMSEKCLNKAIEYEKKGIEAGESW